VSDPLHPNPVPAGCRGLQQERAAAVAQVNIELAVLTVQESDKHTDYRLARFVLQIADDRLRVERCPAHKKGCEGVAGS
jgi:hypothetical protein